MPQRDKSVRLTAAKSRAKPHSCSRFLRVSQSLENRSDNFLQSGGRICVAEKFVRKLVNIGRNPLNDMAEIGRKDCVFKVPLEHFTPWLTGILHTFHGLSSPLIGKHVNTAAKTLNPPNLFLYQERSTSTRTWFGCW